MIYKSLRVGKNGRTFWLYKIKTLRDEPGPESTSADDPRITKVGRDLRKHKIDELPQIWNFLRGDMTLIGPRATTPGIIDSLSNDQKGIILSVKPGFFDLGAVWNYREEEMLRGAEDPHKKFMEEVYPELVKLQIKGIQERSFWGDIKIISRTVWLIIKR